MRPLAGIRIVSVEQFGAAPYGTMFLADLGAEVIKVENAHSGGDPARFSGPNLLGDADSQYFQTWNTNKRSVLLDLKSPEGKADFDSLAISADAVVNNLRGDQPAKLGLDYANLSRLRKDIVCLHISAYGRDNARADRPGYDFLMQAEAGLMSLTGDPESSPARFGPSIIDYMTGMTGMTGLLSCLLSAKKTGVGCDVETSLFEVALHQLGYAGTWYLNEGQVSTRLSRSAHFSVSPVQTYQAADGWIFIMCMTEKFWNVLTEQIGQAALALDPRFVTAKARFENRQALTEALDEVFRGKTVKQWVERLGRYLPIGPVYDVAAALENPFVREIGMIREVPHPERSDMRMLANPLRVNGERLSQTVCSAAGADNQSLFASRRKTHSWTGSDSDSKEV
jgi:crotonobetainyl-CoA:carnitine CoA-transferase CaiB-like acyl-CoA transferase